MLRWIKAGALALMLALPWAFPVGATNSGGVSHLVVTNTTDQLFNAVDETSTALLASPFTNLTIFISGTYENINTLVLQREVGSPGSGAFENVATLTEGTADTRIVAGFTTGPNSDNYRLKMTATGTGAVVAYMTDYPTTARTWVRNATQLVFFDEFQFTDEEASTTVIDVEKYVSQTSNTNAGTIAALVDANREGGLTIVSGSGVSDAATCVSPITAANWSALVSDGWTSFEVRLRADTVTGTTGMHLTDVVCAADYVALVTMTTGTFVQTDSLSESVAGIAMFPDATASTDLMPYSAIADAEGANALEVATGNTFATAAYRRLRVEVDNLGNAFFFVDGAMVHAEPLAVTTTAELVFQVWVDDTDSSANTAVVDYIEFVQPRPTDNST